jgi:hypothetical protein
MTRITHYLLTAALAAAAATLLRSAAIAQGQPPQVAAAVQTDQPQQAPGESASDRPIIRSYNVADLLRAPNDYPLDPSLLPTTAGAAARGDETAGSRSNGGGGSPYGGMSVYGGMSAGMMGRGGGPGVGPTGGMGPAMGAMMGTVGGGGGGGEGQPDAPVSKVSALTLDSLIQLILDTVEADSWRDHGGNGDIRGLGTSIVVTNLPGVHQSVETLLSELRKSEGPSAMVSIDAYWVLLTPDELTALTKASAEMNSGMTIKYDAIDKSKVYSRARTVGFSGQTVHVLSGRARSFVTGVEPVVGTGAIGYQVQTRLLHGGVALQVTPRYVHSNNSEYVVLDLWSVVSEMTPPANANAPAAGAAFNAASIASVAGATGNISTDAAAGSTSSPAAGSGMKVPAVDRPTVVAQQIRTTARIPIRKKVLLGGMTMEPTAAADGPADGGRQLYLVVEANVDQ